jgi:hypothetical protein
MATTIAAAAQENAGVWPFPQDIFSRAVAVGEYLSTSTLVYILALPILEQPQGKIKLRGRSSCSCGKTFKMFVR